MEHDIFKMLTGERGRNMLEKLITTEVTIKIQGFVIFFNITQSEKPKLYILFSGVFQCIRKYLFHLFYLTAEIGKGNKMNI